MENPEKKTPRAQIIDDIVEKFKAEGMADQLVELYTMQVDTCYWAYLAGNATARRMMMEGLIGIDLVHETAMEFTRILVMKITVDVTPRPGDLVIPKPQVPSGILN